MGLCVKSEVGSYLKKKGMRTSGALPDAVDKIISGALDDAAKRAKANGRQTVMEQDL
ncbi:MAG: DUF1931 domain-containing protein [Candidatus Micrarchaeia archaeon]